MAAAGQKHLRRRGCKPWYYGNNYTLAAQRVGKRNDTAR
jgi:hypothetical protein